MSAGVIGQTRFHLVRAPLAIFMSTDLSRTEAEQNELRQSLAELLRQRRIRTVRQRAIRPARQSASSACRAQRDLDAQHGNLDRQLETLRVSQTRLDEASARAESGASNLHDLATRCAADTRPALEHEISRAARGAGAAGRRVCHRAAQAESLSKNVANDLAAARAELSAAAEALVRSASAWLRSRRRSVTPSRRASAGQNQCASGGAQRPVEPHAAAAGAEEPASEDRSTWWGELKQLRSSLGKSSQRPAKQRQPAAASATASGASATQPAAADDPVLDSVMAQFQTLQNELVRGQTAGHVAAK